MTFGEELRRIRESVGASAAQVDRQLGKTNYVARVERGELPAPDRVTAMHLGAVLASLGADIDAKSMWSLAAPERDPEVREFYERQIRDIAGGRLAELEEENRRLRLVLERVRQVIDDPSPPPE